MRVFVILILNETYENNILMAKRWPLLYQESDQNVLLQKREKWSILFSTSIAMYKERDEG